MNSNFLEKSFQSVPRRSYNISDAIWVHVKKMSYKIITFTLILTLFLSPTVQLINAQEVESETEEEPIDLEVLSGVRAQAMSNAEWMEEYFGEDEYSPSIMNSLRHAKEALIKAQQFEDSNNPEAAMQQYLRTMNHYRNAYKKHVLEEEILGDETPGDTTAGDEIEQVNQEDIEVAKAELLARFQERFQEQIQQMIQNVEDLEEDISSEDVEKAQRALTHALQKMLHIQEKIESGKFDEAVDELDEATESLEDEFDKVSDPGTAQMLRTMNQLEARIQKMTEKAARKAAAGEDVSEEGALLEELRGNKNKMKAEFKQNQGHGGEHGNQGGQGKGSN